MQLVCAERAEQDAGPIAQGLHLRGLAQVVQLEHLPSQPLRLSASQALAIGRSPLPAGLGSALAHAQAPYPPWTRAGS